jgi:hypothetical protein
VLGQPALIAALDTGNAEGEALLAEQRVASISRSKGPDLTGLGEVADSALGDVAGPWVASSLVLSGVGVLVLGDGLADRVHAGHEVVVAKSGKNILAE